MNFSILYTKMIKIGAFLKSELHISYVHQKKAEIIWKLVSQQYVSFFKENTDKLMIYQFLTEKSFRLNIFDKEFLKISNIKPKI